MTITKDTFIIADTHFGHANVLEYEPERKTILGDYPDQQMAELWNAAVSPTDTVLHLGDFAFKSEAVHTWTSQLNGRKYLLRGNHDKASQIYLKNGFAEVIDFPNKGEPAYLVAVVGGVRILFSHYSIVSDGYDDTMWRYLSKVFDQEQCHINIHGHVHSMDVKNKFCINVSVEAIGYRPVRLGEILDQRNHRE